MRALLLVPLLALSCDGPKDTGETGTEPTSILPVFSAWLQGRFDSADQAAEDPTYYDITLTMCRASVPDLGTDVLYVEQAVTGSAPYRQRLYVLSEGEPVDQVARSAIWEFEDPEPYAGFCDSGSEEGIFAEGVVPLDGCDVTVAWDGDSFAGGTETGTCLTDYNGATYATSEVTLDATALTSWDRGWDADGEQVWGAVDGPYVFVRRTPIE